MPIPPFLSRKNTGVLAAAVIILLTGCVSIPPVPDRGTDTDFGQRFPAVTNLPPAPPQAVVTNMESMERDLPGPTLSFESAQPGDETNSAPMLDMDANLVWLRYVDTNGLARGLLLRGGTNVGCLTNIVLIAPPDLLTNWQLTHQGPQHFYLLTPDE